MICYDEFTKPGAYSHYKNQKFSKHMDRVKAQINQIQQCSLKPEGKKKLFNELIEQLKKYR